MKHPQVISFGGIEIHYFLDAGDTGGTLTLFKCVIHPGAKIPAPHYHDTFEETVFGLKGTIVFTLNGETFDLGIGESMFIPRGAVHGFNNKSDESVEFLCHATPGVFGPEYFEELSAVINAGGPPDMAKIKETMLKHGLTPVAA